MQPDSRDLVALPKLQLIFNVGCRNDLATTLAAFQRPVTGRKGLEAGVRQTLELQGVPRSN
jgi:hypothetical protein